MRIKSHRKCNKRHAHRGTVIERDREGDSKSEGDRGRVRKRWK